MIKVFKIIHLKIFVKSVNFINLVIELLKNKNKAAEKKGHKKYYGIYSFWKIFYEGRRNPEKVVTGMS